MGAGLGRRITAVALPVLGTLAVVGLWWLATAVFRIGSFLLPPPDQVVAGFTRLPAYLLSHSRVTLTEAVAGYAVAVVAGLAAGLLLASSPVVQRSLLPALVALHAVPKLALAPLLVVALGFGLAPKVVMVVLVCVFPIVLATATGLRTTPVELVELARSMCATRWQTFMKIRLKAALPDVFIGLKTAAPLAVIGATVGELFGAVAGLGFVIRVAGSDTAVVFAALVLLAAMSIVLFYLLVGLERLLVPWLAHTTS